MRCKSVLSLQKNFRSDLPNLLVSFGDDKCQSVERVFNLQWAYMHGRVYGVIASGSKMATFCLKFRLVGVKKGETCRWEYGG